MKNKICVYAIAKNESQFVERWYNSMKEADCIVVLDTGSSDDTVEKLRNLGVKVEQKIITPWRFDVARNESMKLIPDDCNILVCTDLDQYFDDGWGDILRDNWIEEKHSLCQYGYYITETSKIIYSNIHCRGWHWIFPVHECPVVENDDGTIAKKSVLDLFDKITLYHKQDTSRDRRPVYFPLLELRVKENPDDFFGLYYLIREYEDIDINKAIELTKRGINVSDDFIRFIYAVLLAKLYDKIEDNENALFYYKMSLTICNEYRFVYYLLAKLLFNYKQDYEQSYQYLIQGLKYSILHNDWIEEETAFGYEYYDLLSMSAFYSGRKMASLAAAIISKEKCKNEEERRIKENIDIILNQITDKDFFEYEK